MPVFLTLCKLLFPQQPLFNLVFRQSLPPQLFSYTVQLLALL